MSEELAIIIRKLWILPEEKWEEYLSQFKGKTIDGWIIS